MCTLANGAGVRLEFIEAGSAGLLPSYKPPLILEPGEVASFLVDKNIPFRLNYNIQTFQGPFAGWLGGDTNTAVTVTSSTTVRAQISTDVQVDRTTKYPTQIYFDVSIDGDFFHIFATQLIDAPPSYTLMSDALSWGDADAACLAAGLQLATVQSAAQNAALVTAAAGNQVWIGGTDAASEGTWGWSPSNTPRCRIPTGTHTSPTTQAARTACSLGRPEARGMTPAALANTSTFASRRRRRSSS